MTCFMKKDSNKLERCEEEGPPKLQDAQKATVKRFYHLLIKVQNLIEPANRILLQKKLPSVKIHISSVLKLAETTHWLG